MYVGRVTATTSSEGATASKLDFDLIEQRAKDLNIGLVRLAERAGITRSTLWRYRGGMVPSLEIAERIAEVLELSLDEIKAKGNPTPPPPTGPSTPTPPSGPKQQGS